jgi:hypothetical protein
MKTYYLHKILFCLLCFLMTSAAFGQGNFLVGSGNVSIDPDSTTFSLPLAGYGAPREGRFTIEWQYQRGFKDLKYLAAAGDKLYAVSSAGKLLSGDPKGRTISWKIIGDANDVKGLTGSAHQLIAITTDNQIKAFDLKKQKGWLKLGRAENLRAITLMQGKLYVATAANTLMQGSFLGKKISWKTIGPTSEIITLTNDGNKIYGVDAAQTLYSIKPGTSQTWLKIGLIHGSTWTIKLKQVLVYKKRLWALGDDDKFYIGIHNTDHNLSARSLAVKSKDKTVIVVTLDLTGFDYSLGKAVKDIIFKKRKIPQSAIIINASHTHFAPVSQWFPTFGEHGQTPDSIYFNHVLKKAIVRSIEMALDHMVPASIYFGRGSTNIGHNRSSANGETPYDNTVDVLKVENGHRKITNLLFLTGCHPVFKNEGKEGVAVSANFPGVSRKILEEKTGSKTALFIQGCAGDINPRDDDHRKTGADLGNDVLKILDHDMSQLKGGVAYTMDTISIAANPWSREKVLAFKEEALKEPGNVYAEKNVRWANMMLNYYLRDAMPKTMPVYVQTITIGNWKLVGLSREVVTEYGPAIRAIWPDKLVSVAGYCNDVPSYLPVARHIQTETYEGVDSFFWNAQPSLFPVDIFDRIIEGIKKIKN